MLRRAVALYQTIETHAHDRTHGGYDEELLRDWTLQTNLRDSLFGSEGPRSKNTHLHLRMPYPT